MNFGYKTFLALTLATAACWRTKAQNTDSEIKRDSVEIPVDRDNHTLTDSLLIVDDIQQEPELPDSVLNQEEAQIVSNYILEEDYLAKHNITTEINDSLAKDSTLQEQIYQSILDIEPDLLRFMGLSEDIKFRAYPDYVGHKITIGNGLTTINGRKVRRSDVIHSEAEMIELTRDKYKKEIVPIIAKYLPNWAEFEKHEKIVLLDLFWNTGGGKDVLTNGAAKNLYWRTLNEEQKQELVDSLCQKNVKITEDGQTYALDDLPEWRNLTVAEKSCLTAIYYNEHIVKSGKTNPNYTDNWQILAEHQRQEVADIFAKQQAQKTSLVPEFYDQADPRMINDSTLRYQGYVTQEDITQSDVPPWYLLKEERKQAVIEKLAKENNYVIHNGHKILAKDIPVWYFLPAEEKQDLQNLFGDMELLKQNSRTHQFYPILSGLCCELNLYLMNKTSENKERVATRLSSFSHSGEKVISGLLKRASVRAKVFTGELRIDSMGDNAINLDEIKLSSIYSLSLKDLDNPQTICEKLINCPGKNYADTIRHQESLVRRKMPSRNRSNSTSKPNRAQTRMSIIRTGSRER